METTITAELVHHGERRDRLGRQHVPPARRRELLAIFRESGLTRHAFARREGIRYTTFCTWVQREEKAPVAPAPPMAPQSVAPVAVRFAEVSLPPIVSPATSATALLEVRLPDGTTLRGERAQELAVLARALRS